MNNCIGIVLLGLAWTQVGSAAAQDAGKKDDLRLTAPEDWKGERIALPPAFAPGMKLKGIEEIRFAPGMFDDKQDTFFSYVFVFRVEAKPQLTEEILRREMLAYYGGLSVAVSKSRNIEVDSKGFTLKLTATKPAAKDAPRPQGLTSFQGELSWVEPFVTGKPQTLYLDLEAWQDAAAQHSYLFVMVSPKGKTEKVWTTMREIRAGFHQETK